MRNRTRFALAVGSFAGGAAGTPILFGRLTADGLSTLGLAVVVATLASIVVTGLTRALASPADVERLQAHHLLNRAGLALGILYLGLTIQLSLNPSGVDTTLLYGGLAGTALTVLGFAGGIRTSRAQRTARLVEDSEFYISLPSTKTPARLRRERRLGAVAGVALGGVTAYVFLTQRDPPLVLFAIALVGIVQLLRTNADERGLTESGLRVGNRIYPWSAFDGYDLSEGSLRFVRAGDDVTIRRDRLSHEDDVVSVLEMIFEGD